jgi:predicted NBD/HSP70 family sugar kinase
MPTATVEECLSSTDPASVAAVKAFAEDLAGGIAALVLATAPDAVVVGGALSTAGEALLGPLRSAMSHHTLYEPALVTATHAADGVAYGALNRSLEQAFAEVLELGTGT